MSKIKKVLTVLTASVITMTFVACGKDKSWSAEIEDNTYTPGTYIYGCVQGYSSALSKLTDLKSGDDVFDKEIDGVSVETYIKNNAEDFLKRIDAVSRKFDELGLEYTDTDKKAVENQVESEYTNSSDKYKDLGIAEKSLNAVFTAQRKQNMIFEYYYGIGGEKEIPQDEIDKYYDENNALVRIIPVKATDSDNKALEGEAKDKVKEKVEDYKKRIEDGENFMDVLDEYYKETYDTYSVTDEQKADETRGQYIVYKGYYYLPTEVVDKSLSMDKDALEIIETDDAFYLIKKYDVLTKTEEKEAATQSIKYTLKGEEYSDTIETWTNDLTITVNNDFVDSYKIKNIQKIFSK